MSIFTRLFLGLVTLVAFSQAESFTIDKAHSHVGFSIKHMMITNVKGNFDKYDGEIVFNTSTNKFEKLSANIDASSINTGIQSRDDHLRSSDFFDVQKYPNINFEMISFKDDDLKGKLTINGVTKDVELEASIHGVIKDFQGKQRVGFTLEGEINRKDFGLTWNKLTEAGGLSVGEKVKITIEIEAAEK